MLFTATVEIDAFGVATVGRSGYGETAMIGVLTRVSGRVLGIALESLDFWFGGAVRTEKRQGGNQSDANDEEADKHNEEMGHGGVEGGGRGS